MSFYQVNLVSRITGEVGGRSFEGRGGVVLIKSERVWRGGGDGGQFVHVSYILMDFVFFGASNRI